MLVISYFSKNMDLQNVLECHKIRTYYNSTADYSQCKIATEAPSITPSASPSSDPVCQDEILGRTFYSPAAGACWKIEVFTNGTLEGDFSDSSCSKDPNDFTPSGVFSIFDFMYENVAYFKDGAQEYSGTFEFKEDSSKTDLELTLKGWEPTAKEYDVELTLPTCTAPSSVPSSVPSNIPTVDSSCMDEIYGGTFYTPAVGACWQIEIFENGTLEGDFSDSTCSKDKAEFTSTDGIFSYFNYTYGNVAYFVDGPNQYSGTFEFKEDTSVSDLELEIQGWNPTALEYTLLVTVPSCELA